ncbi:amidohydrolase [Thalassotalea agarivorans]|uniref:Amidohydrolase 3 domain-containing protein n=1 Tax=Thalassotalea agarivorans TaxID=349064 RepID=A0A1I0DEA0_THASX|nr:amidohydrolase [Thalassotalea agarivorans]SET30667.1 hypothetical protein SAMN05660429_01481 [Thalassotalea agarivorans]
MRRFSILFVLIFVTAACTEQQSDTHTPSNVKLMHGGTIYTMEEGSPTAEVVVYEGADILFVGDKAAAMQNYPNAEQIDLQGNTLMPGFIEQHMHPFLGALTLRMVVIAPETWEIPGKTWPAAVDGKDYMNKLVAAEAAMEDPNEIMWSWGYNNFFHGELNREMLDNISMTRPIAVWHRSCHEFYFNTAAIKHFNLNQDDINKLGKQVIEQSDLDKGHFYEGGALVYLLPIIFPELASPERMEAGLKQMVTMLQRKGVTAYMEPGAFIAPGSDKLYLDILGDKDTPMYSYFVPETKTPYVKFGKDGLLEAVEASKQIFPSSGKIRFLDKQIKILADGAIISQLMMMKEGYLDGHEGEWIQAPGDIEDITEVFWKEGYQIHVHVNGDLGLEKVLDIFSKRMDEYPRKDHRSIIVHFANSTEQQVAEIKQLGLLVSANPYYVTGFSERFGEVGLGEERAHAMVRLAQVEKAGISTTLHSDLPMAPSDPLYLAWSAATRMTNSGNVIRPELALSREAALKAITIEAAYSWRMEDQLGSLKAGKIANFTILEKDPYQVPLAQLKDIAVVSTVFEGKIYSVLE